MYIAGAACGASKKSGVAFCGCKEFPLFLPTPSIYTGRTYIQCISCTVDSCQGDIYIYTGICWLIVKLTVASLRGTKEGRTSRSRSGFVEKRVVISAQTRTSLKNDRKNGISEFTPRYRWKNGRGATFFHDEVRASRGNILQLGAVAIREGRKENRERELEEG